MLSGQLKTTPALLLVSIVVVLPFIPFLFGYFTITGDTLDVFVPLESFFRQQQLSGDLPVWNPDIAWGFPTIAAAQIGFFYPPLLVSRFLPVTIYLPLLVILHTLLSSTSFYAYGRTLKTSSLASAMGAATYALSGFAIQHITHLNIFFSIAWLPAQLLLTHHLALKKKLTAGHIALLAIIIAIPFTIGQLHLPLLQALVAAAYFVFLRQRNKRPLAKTGSVLLVVIILSVLLAAAQLLPTGELFQQSSRNSNGQFDITRANQHSFPIYHLQTSLFPRFFGNDDTYWGKRLEIEYGFFIGTIPLVLAIHQLFTRKQRMWQHKWYTWLVIVTFLLALGSFSPFRLVGFEPSLWVFSAPARWLLFTSFGLSVLATLGFDTMFKETQTYKKIFMYAAGSIIAVVVIGNIIIFSLSTNTLTSAAVNLAENSGITLTKSQAYYTEKIDSILTSAQQSSVSLKSPFTALTILSLVAVPLAIHNKHAKTIIPIVISAELVIIAATTSPYLPFKDFLNPPTTIAELPQTVQKRQARIMTIRPEGDTGAILTNPTSRPTIEDRYTTFGILPPLTHSMFDIPGIAWPASLDIATHATILENIQSIETQSLQKAEQYNVGAALHIDNSNNVAIEQLNPHPRAFLENSPNTVSYQTFTPTHQRLSATTDQEDQLVVLDTYYPGWEATVNGEKTPIEQTDTQFRSITLPPGTHEIDMTYTSTSTNIGIAITALTLAICTLAIYKNREELLA